MDAIIIPQFRGPEVLKYRKVPKLTPTTGEVLVHMKAFGLNHAEMHLRKGEWDEWNPITGPECVGIVEACPGREVEVGSKVIAVMGCLGRNRPGGYDEFVNVPASNVVPIEAELPWEELAALPEVWQSA